MLCSEYVGEEEFLQSGCWDSGNTDISAVKEHSLQARSVFWSNAVIFPDPLPPTPSTSSAMNIFGSSASLVKTEETPENIEGNPNIPEPAAEGDTQMIYSSY
jgi:hypothetical protein